MFLPHRTDRGISRAQLRNQKIHLHLENLEERVVPVAFGAGNLAIYRVGVEGASLTSSGTAVFIDEYTPAGTLVQSIALPVTDPDGAGPQRTFVASGTSSTEGFLTRSADGRYLVLPGYVAGLGTSGLTTSSVPRVVGRIDADGNVDTSTALTDWSGGNRPQSVASTNGTALWVSGAAGGVRSTTFGASTSTGLTTLADFRQVNIFDGQIYASTKSITGNTVAIGTVGTGLPLTGPQPFTNLPGFPVLGSTSRSAFFLVDLSAAVPGLDTLYVADDAVDQIQKYSLTGGNWTASGAISANNVRGLTGAIDSSGNVAIFGTTGGTGAIGGGSLYAFTDSTGFNNAISGSATVIATAATNTAFRGIAFTPAAPATATTSTLMASTSSAEYGTPVTFTATVAASSGSLAPRLAQSASSRMETHSAKRRPSLPVVPDSQLSLIPLCRRNCL